MEKPTVFVCVFLFVFALPASEQRYMSRPEVSTTSGQLIGTTIDTDDGLISHFLGVRYAKSPIGNRRFLPAQPLDESESDGIVDATKYHPSCMQPKSLTSVMYPQLTRNHSDDVSEDCLFLNVFVPHIENDDDEYDEDSEDSASLSGSKTPLAVMVWIPGEGYSFGMSRHYNATRLALKGAIVVTVNYRLSAFGFLSTGDEHAPGNAGLTDIATALAWVRENIANFGGDRERITLFGRFTGAMSITSLLASPLATKDDKPLFHKAIVQSGVAGDQWTIDRHPMNGARGLATRVGCSTLSTDEMMQCLRNVSAEKINEVALFVHSWRLVLDSNTLPDEPLRVIKEGNHLPVPVIVGMTKDEGSLCVLTHMFMQSKYNDRIQTGTLTEDDFTELLNASISEHFGRDLPEIVAEISEHYKQIGDSTWAEKYLKVCGDMMIFSRSTRLAHHLSTHGSRVYLYLFNHRPSQSFFPNYVTAAHGDDILFSFGFVNDYDDATTGEKRLSNEMMTSFVNFASNSNPDPMFRSKKTWKPFSIDRKVFWEFSTSGKKMSKHIPSDWATRENLWQKASDASRTLHHHHHSHHHQE